MSITDEMVEIAYEAARRDPFKSDLRAALEAVAPLLIAQGMREAAKAVWHKDDHDLILARAQELDPK